MSTGFSLEGELVHLAKTRKDNGIRVRKSLSSAKGKSSTWGLRQANMVRDIADHALNGGRSMLGAGASDEEAIDAYLKRLRQDLIQNSALES